MKINAKSIVEYLVEYTREMSDVEMDKTQLAGVRLVYEIIAQAAQDAHSSNAAQAADAKKYFSSDLFDDHCNLVNINKELMLYIVEHQSNFTRNLEEHQRYDVYKESDEA